MTSKREKLQYAYVFFADLLTMAVSVLLAWLITDGLFGVLIPYTSTDWLQTLCLLFVAFVVTFFFFDQDKNIVTRSENEEISLSLRFNIALGLVYAGCMLLAKAPRCWTPVILRSQCLRSTRCCCRSPMRF